ncbi:hypothetical protein [Leptolyngbya sp. FACHB-711]|uniref:hypothetical protein n=1 Tax=Leptolyngbya sp. FACHB-711 TaxID=2692813 RepID=UPI001685AF10|nr:hypothetical protein [Leptolyngbya sp. FACHB-711]MBD2024208.1 hypothetical protein [Leptolyngbya sp. FACHB-711]
MPRSSSAVSPTSISSIADSLTTLPEKTKEGYTLREAVAALADPIHTALERGYSYADIAVILHDHGIPISPASLKAYLPQKEQPKRRTRRPRKTETLPIIEAVSTPELTPEPVEVPAETAPAEEAAPKKRRGRQPGTKTAAAETAVKPATKTATKTAAKSKAAPRTTASKGRGRKKQS